MSTVASTKVSLNTLDVSASDFDCVKIQKKSIRTLASFAGKSERLEYLDVVEFLGGSQAAKKQGYSKKLFRDLLAEISARHGNSFHIPSVFDPAVIESISCQEGDPEDVVHVVDILPMDQANTQNNPVHLDEKKVYTFPEDGVSIRNDFPTGRLSEVTRTAPNTYTVLIRAETKAPINDSAWYSFKIQSTEPKEIEIKFTYEGTSTDEDEQGNLLPVHHRYHPKTSVDGNTWSLLDKNKIQVGEDNLSATATFSIGPEPLWVSAQEIQSSTDIYAWMDELAQLPYAKKTVIGKSIQGKDIVRLDFVEGNPENPYVIFLGGQHPPEVTGRMAMMSFVETLCGDTELAQNFRQNFNIIVIPMINPDGIDAGFWRYNMHGVDLNRNWQEFNQPETQAVRDNLSMLDDHPVAFTADFHSTAIDTVYFLEKPAEGTPEGRDRDWFNGLFEALPSYVPGTKTVSASYPVSMAWMNSTFKTPTLTYEVGDDTERERLKQIASTAARVLMMQLLESEK